MSAPTERYKADLLERVIAETLQTAAGLIERARRRAQRDGWKGCNKGNELMNCVWCDEPIGPGEISNLRNTHRECALRMIRGSVAHIERRCGCFVEGSRLGDPPGVSKREAARAAAEAFEAIRRAGLRKQGVEEVDDADPS